MNDIDNKRTNEAKAYIARRREAERKIAAYLSALLANAAKELAKELHNVHTARQREQKRNKVIAALLALLLEKTKTLAMADAYGTLSDELSEYINRTIAGATLQQRTKAYLSMFTQEVIDSTGLDIKRGRKPKDGNTAQKPQKSPTEDTTTSQAYKRPLYALKRLLTTTIADTWMKRRHIEATQANAVGFYVERGSSYPCQTCDSMTGYHNIADTNALPPYHPNCCCMTIYVYD